MEVDINKVLLYVFFVSSKFDKNRLFKGAKTNLCYLGYFYKSSSNKYTKSETYVGVHLKLHSEYIETPNNT
jgi:hypothetical protein